MTKDYSKELMEGIEVIRDKVRRGMFPLVARNPALDKLTSDYALAQAEQYDRERASGKNPPIPLRDSDSLCRCADLVLHEELTWSHPDKMSIIEYPIASERNEKSHREKYMPHGDLQYGDRRFQGRRKSNRIDDSGRPHVWSSKIAVPYDEGISRLETLIDLQDALDNAGLTDRQRQAIDLVYFEDMTQEQAAEEMGVSQPNISSYIAIGLRKIREYMTKE